MSRYLLSGILQCGVCDSNFIMADARCYRCSSHTNGGQHCCSNGIRVRRDVVEPIVLRGVKQDLLSDAALAEVRHIVAKAQRGKKKLHATARHKLRDVEAAIERVTDAIAEAGISRALRDKLQDLEQRRDDLENQLRAAEQDTGAIDLVPRVIDQWRELVGNMEHLALHPDARPEDMAEAREHLARLIGRVRLMPKDGELVAQVDGEQVALAGLRAPEDSTAHIRVVAGVGFEPTTFGL